MMSIQLEKIKTFSSVYASSQRMLLSMSLLKQHSKDSLKLVRRISENMFDVLKEHKEAHKIAMKQRYYNQFPKVVLQLPKFF